MILSRFPLLDAGIIEQGGRPLAWVWSAGRRVTKSIHPRTRPNRFFEAGPTAFGGCGYAGSFLTELSLALRVAGRHLEGGWSGFVAELLARTGAHEHAPSPVGRVRRFSRLGPLKLVRVALGRDPAHAPERGLFRTRTAS